MTSTYLSYRLYSSDMSKALSRTAAQTNVAREAEYYRANIGKVASIDDFLKDQRLYAYAMKAHGLEDMTYAKAFMRKVLESDLDDRASFARGLVDTRYAAFARMFNFTSDGTVSASAVSIQTDQQQDDTLGLYSAHRVKRGEVAATEVQYFQTQIENVTSIDGFLRDERLFNFVLTAHGVEAKYASTTTIRNVLSSDLSDPDSTANRLGGAYLELARAFDFAGDGSAAPGAAQTAAQKSETVLRYFTATGNDASPAAAAVQTEAYRAGIAALTSVDDLLANDRLYTYALTAFGIDPTYEVKEGMRLVLTSDLSDPSSPANSLSDTRYRTLAAAFNFATDGSISGTEGAQSEAQLESTADLYFERYDDKAATTDSSAMSYFVSRIDRVENVDQLLADQRLYTFVLQAVGLEPAQQSKEIIRRVLTTDPSNAKGFLGSLSDPRYRELAGLLNFSADGKVTSGRLAQSENEELATIKLYSARAGSSEAEISAARTATTAYHDALLKIRNVDQLIADKTTLGYVLKAYDIDAGEFSNADLKRALVSDPLDSASFAAKSGDKRLRDLAAAFNFNADGSLDRIPKTSAQSLSGMLTTQDLFVRQTMESEAGQQSESLRLALYFERKAGNINTAYDILADKALIEVVRTALNLPTAFQQADVDAQAKMIENRIKFADLKDPAKVEKFLAQFGALYDLNNGTSNASSIASILFGNGASSGIDMGLLGSIQTLSLGRR